MEWKVYCEHNGKIQPYNIFNHGSFAEYVNKWLKECKIREVFEERLKSELRYYFWSKCEWELIIEIAEDNRIILSPWIGNKDKVFIDVTDDRSFDWRNFAEKHIRKYIYNDNKAKIDVFDQINYVWDDFVDYVWNNKE